MHRAPSPSAAQGGGALDFEASLPEGLVYRPEFISLDEEADLLRQIERLPLQEATYKAYTAKRRIVSFGSSYDFGRNALDAAPAIPEFLFPLREKIAAWVDLPAALFGHALVTEYRPGTTLGWHRDVHQFGAIVGVSLASPCRMRFRPYPPAATTKADVFALELQPRSAYVLRGAIRWRWQHSVAPTRSLRYSITFRSPAKG
jgi:alkylated DNA repair dioxygenase AlkB